MAHTRLQGKDAQPVIQPSLGKTGFGHQRRYLLSEVEPGIEQTHTKRFSQGPVKNGMSEGRVERQQRTFAYVLEKLGQRCLRPHACGPIP
ncbi:MAG: hypothetical protein ACYC9J_09000 [Sulfuricaulis sp.]